MPETTEEIRARASALLDRAEKYADWADDETQTAVSLVRFIRDDEAEACIALIERARPSGKFRPNNYDDGRNDACNDISEAIRARIKARQNPGENPEVARE